MSKLPGPVSTPPEVLNKVLLGLPFCPSTVPVRSVDDVVPLNPNAESKAEAILVSTPTSAVSPI